MFRTSRTARRSHAPLACVGRWTRPARGRSRAAWIVGLAAVLVAALSSPAVAASPTRGAVYAHGSPGDNTAVELRVSPRGSRFADIDIALFMPCSNGRRALGSFLWFAGLSRPSQVPIKRDGTHVGEAGTVCDSGDRRVIARRQTSQVSEAASSPAGRPASTQKRSILGTWTGKLTARELTSARVTLKLNRLKVGRRAGQLFYEEQGCLGTLRLLRRTKRSFTFRYRETALNTGCVWDDEIVVRKRGRHLFMRVAASDLDDVSEGLLRRCVCDGIFSR